MNSHTEEIKRELLQAKQLAEEVFGTDTSPEIVAATLNAMTAHKLSERLESMTQDLCRAAAVAAGA